MVRQAAQAQVGHLRDTRLKFIPQRCQVLEQRNRIVIVAGPHGAQPMRRHLPHFVRPFVRRDRPTVRLDSRLDFVECAIADPSVRPT